MKKYLKKICLLALILFIITAITTTIFGNTYTTTFRTHSNPYELSMTGSTGEVEILEEKVIGNKYIIKVKAKKPGKVYLYFTTDEFTEEALLYIHKNMVITDNTFFGRSTASEIIPITFSIFLLYILYILIKEYRRHELENHYQYRNIAYLGIIIFLSFFTLNNIFSIFNYQGLYETVNKTMNTISLISIALFPIAFITFILVTISNINLIRKEGKSLKNLLGLFLGIFICLLTVLPDYIYNKLMIFGKIDIFNLNSPGPYIYNFIEAMVYLVITYLECILIATIIAATKSIKKKPAYNKDYMIILGCQLKKDGTLTPLLKGRVDKALEFRDEELAATGKDLIFIPSGGQGPDEVISEAEAMKNYLLTKGIKEKHILVENKSKNTYENIAFSNKLIKDKSANIAFSTNNYHVLRAGLIATELGLVLEGVGSKTKAYFWINAFIREFIGTLYAERKKHIIFFSLVTITIMIMILITYFANNI